MKALTLSVLLALAGSAAAQDMGKLLTTAGVVQVEGAGGGGLTPWALISGYGSRDSWGANAHWTTVVTRDYTLNSFGVTAGFADRVEVSLAHQSFQGSLAPLDKLNLRQDILGLKWRVAGDAVVDQDRWMPQLAVGAMFKRDSAIHGLEALKITNVKQLGARDDSDIDLYLAATKIILEHSVLLNGTLRATRANQFGLLGFGGDKHSGRRLRPELSFAYLLRRDLVLGAEWRAKQANLGTDPAEGHAHDAFLAWFPNKQLSLTAAYVNLGQITAFNSRSQRGWYFSAQAGF